MFDQINKIEGALSIIKELVREERHASTKLMIELTNENTRLTGALQVILNSALCGDSNYNCHDCQGIIRDAEDALNGEHIK